jgi:hypothetical protein
MVELEQVEHQEQQIHISYILTLIQQMDYEALTEQVLVAYMGEEVLAVEEVVVRQLMNIQFMDNRHLPVETAEPAEMELVEVLQLLVLQQMVHLVETELEDVVAVQEAAVAVVVRD